MKYKITLINNSDYCHLAPSDPECQYPVIIYADNKAKAVHEIHDRAGMTSLTYNRPCAKRCNPHNIAPEVWSIEEVS
jgi:hypothetical protein